MLINSGSRFFIISIYKSKKNQMRKLGYLFAIGSLIHIVKHELEKLKNKVYSHKWVGVGIFASVLTSFLFWI